MVGFWGNKEFSFLTKIRRGMRCGRTEVLAPWKLNLYGFVNSKKARHLFYSFLNRSTTFCIFFPLSPHEVTLLDYISCTLSAVLLLFYLAAWESEKF
jgi:hypothetical protein